MLTGELWAIAPMSGERRTSAKRPAPTAGHVAVIPFVGELTKDVMVHLRDQVYAVAESPNIGAVLLLFDTPGGTVAGTADLALAVRRLAEKKHTIAFCEDLCASAGYWIASQATTIVANATAAIGSIGVYRTILDASEAMRRAGVMVYIVRSSGADHKGATVEGASLTETQLAEIQKRVDAVARLFIADVARGRRKPAADIEAIADGRVFIGQEAVPLLVDRIATLEDVLAELRQQTEQRNRQLQSICGFDLDASHAEWQKRHVALKHHLAQQTRRVSQELNSGE